ncbi:TPA: hypothetical protein QFQ28_001530 [Enterococcus faecium]
MNKKVLIDKQALIDELMKIPGVGSNSICGIGSSNYKFWWKAPDYFVGS